MSYDRVSERLAWVSAATLAVMAGGLYLSGTGLPAAVPAFFLLQLIVVMLSAALVGALCGVHAYVARLAAEERQEQSVADHGQGLFSDEADTAQRHQQIERQFRKLVVPLLIVMIGSLELGLTWRTVAAVRGHLPALLPAAREALLAPASLSAVLALVCFLAGKYLAGVGYGDRRLHLRPLSGWVLLAAAANAAAVVACLLLYWGLPGFAQLLAWVLIVLSAFLACERVAGWIIDLYRPHASDVEALPVYESRLLALFSQPRGVVQSIAEMVEYQFGLQISGGWLSRLLFSLLLPFLALQVVTLLALSAIVYIGPGECGLAERWGHAEIETLSPGLYLRPPWPATIVTRVPVEQLMSIDLAPNLPPRTAQAPVLQLWQDPSFAQCLFITGNHRDSGGTAGLLAVTARVVYRVVDARAYAFGQRNTRDLLTIRCRRDLTRYLLSHDQDELLRADRSALAAALKEALAVSHLGVEIVAVIVDHLQPPPATAAAFHAVLTAGEDSRRARLAAQAGAVALLAQAEHEALAIRRTAAAEKQRVAAFAEVEKANFQSQHAVYEKYPRLYRTREAMDAVSGWLARDEVRKYVVTVDAVGEQIRIEMKPGQPDLMSALEEE